MRRRFTLCGERVPDANKENANMSTALPFLSELRGVEYRFVGCNAVETSAEVDPNSDAPCTLGQPAAASATIATSDTAAAVVEVLGGETSASSPKEANDHSAEGAPVHNRIAQVREQQGISQRTMARRMRIDLKSYQALERPETDLRHSQLIALQAALEVPLVDLLEDTQSLSRPVAERAKMIKVMKTAAALRETSSNARVERMVESLCEQLIDVMPELAEVSSWPQYGSRRGSSAIGKALAQQICVADLGFTE